MFKMNIKRRLEVGAEGGRDQLRGKVPDRGGELHDLPQGAVLDNRPPRVQSTLGCREISCWLKVAGVISLVATLLFDKSFCQVVLVSELNNN